MIRALLARPPEAEVAVGGPGTRTAGDLLADSARVAHALRAAGPGEVLLIFEDRYALAAALLGTWRAGRAALLPPNGQPETIRSLTGARAVAAFLHDRDGAPEGTHVAALPPAPPGEGAIEPMPPDAVVATLATSGSTGAHQLCPKTARQLLGEAETLVAEFGMRPGDRVLATVPAHHIYGLLFGVLAPLRAGAAFVRETPLHAETVAAALARHCATHLVSVPAHLRALDGLDARPSGVARVFSSGAPLAAGVARAAAGVLGAPITEVYGSSETGGIAWRDAPDDPWRPFPGVSVAADADGRMLLESPLLPPDSPAPLRFADCVATLPDGRFTLLGRADGVVKVAGKRVALAELEARALAIPGVRDAAAWAEPVGGARGVELWLAIAADGAAPESVREALARWFEPAQLPRRIRVLERLPREGTGKLTRRALRAIFAPAAPVVDVEPDATETSVGADGAETRVLHLTIPPDLHWFRGHFPERPVLPGVVQLHTLVLRQTQRSWPDLPAPRKLLQVKFKRIIGPGARVTLRLVRGAGARRVTYDLSVAGASCASGTLVFPPGAAP